MAAAQAYVNELTENPGVKKEDLEELKCWLSTQQHLPPISEDQLIVFLHSCYYNVAQTMDCIEKYYTLRTKAPEIFTNRDLKRPENQKMLTVVTCIELPVKDPNGYNILFHSLKESAPSEYILADSARLYFMMVDWCIRCEGTPSGISLMFDASGVKFGHLIRLSLSLVHKILTYVQEGLPVRLKAIHVLNSISVIEHLMYLIKPFMNKELLKLIHFHKGNNETIYQYFPKECLPQDYGGELPTLAELHASYILRLSQSEGYFKEEEKFRVDESKRSNRRKNKHESVTSDH
ncbi:hypothetical protein Cfor_12750 [Coptotermes formosanus]|uniref:CRAL-TRIO domain-containing protein n=1 Tax=Coptotermes formosanus TaxID=36987 RepID=A0A6L2PSL0_COPFO|nr:hypothetical protein Cfor_12750 [Coptotermes formosanus]